MSATISDLKAEVARMGFLLQAMDTIDPTVVAVHDPDGAFDQMRAVTRQAVAALQESIDECADLPDRVLQLAYEHDWLREVIEPVRRNRKTLEDWLGLSD